MQELKPSNTSKTDTKPAGGKDKQNAIFTVLSDFHFLPN